MQEMILTTLTRDDLETLVIDCLKSYHKYNPAGSRSDSHPPAPARVLTVDEAAALTGFAKSTIYKMTSGGTMPHSKRGKKLYFDRQEIEAWLLQERQTTNSDNERLATEQLTRAARGRG